MEESLLVARLLRGAEIELLQRATMEQCIATTSVSVAYSSTTQRQPTRLTKRTQSSRQEAIPR
jgi:hypothetical protein